MNRLTYAIAVTSTLLLISPISTKALADQENQPAMEALGSAVSEDTLSANRGGHTEVVNTNNLKAQLYNNQASYNITGTNTVNDGAFTNASGFATVIQNSGNNVIIQNATILNLNLQ